MSTCSMRRMLSQLLTMTPGSGLRALLTLRLLARIGSLTVPALAAPVAIADVPSAGQARAPEASAVELGFAVKENELRVTDGRSSARLGVTASVVVGSRRSKDGNITVEYKKPDFYCIEGVEAHTFSAAHLRAYLDNAEALRLHARKDYAQAEQGFARAVALHPTFKKAVFNLACAQTRQNKKEAALTTLAGFLRDEPVETYLHVQADPDLAPLLETPPLRAIETGPTGDARIRFKGGKLAHAPVMVAPDRHLLAVTVSSEGWNGLQKSVDLVVLDTKTGKTAASWPLVQFDDYSIESGEGKLTRDGRRNIVDRLAAANGFLAKFGLTPAKDAERGVPKDEARAMRFPNGGLGLALSTGEKVRVLRKNEVLREVPVPYLTYLLTSAYYLPTEKLLVFTWHIDEPEGCAIEQERAGVQLVDLHGR